MRSVTGIELGADSCVIARVRPSRETLRVSAVHGLYDGDWDSSRTLGDSLRDVRRSKGFPRRARVVAWGLDPTAAAGELATNPGLAPLAQALLAPLAHAGFVVDACISPPQALARMAHQRPRAAGRAAAAWLSLNRHGAAIAIVHEGELLYAREFDWNYRAGATVKEELLQRYSLIAHLAPELRHGFDVVRGERGVAVDTVVTCGDLPELRSLTMPLTEELDIEVETLDTLDGVTVVSPLRPEDITDRAPALRLASAAALSTSPMPDSLVRRWVAAAAVLLIVAVLFAQYAGRRGEADVPAPATATPVGSAATSQGQGQRGNSGVQRPAVQGEVTSDRPQSPEATPAATTGRREPVVASSTAYRPQKAEAPRPAEPRPTLPAPRRGAVIETAAPVERSRAVATKALPTPLKDPLPMVNSILVSPERRLAVVDGEIIREGEHVGRRVLIRIEPNALVFREPSGYEVRVPIRRKLGAVESRDAGIHLEP
jgi:hypothetical protein